MKFVIVMPTYNRSEKIKRAIQSVIEQTYNNWEIIIVDDHSQEFHKTAVMQYVRDLDKIQYHYLDQNHGHCYARNYALDLIKDDDVWVKYLDDDDIILPNCLEDIANFVKSSEYDVITTDYIKSTEDKDINVSTNYLEISVFDGALDTCAICHKISLYKRIGGWDCRLYRMADDDFFFNYITNGKYGYLNKTTSVFFATNDADRVTNQVPNLQYISIVAQKYEYFNRHRCLIVIKNETQRKFIEQEEYNIESFLPFDIGSKQRAEYDFVLFYNDNTSVNAIFQHYYKTHEKMFKIGKSVFVCKK
jgi:glycosyltransferase involved in cell wall biosynthesis